MRTYLLGVCVLGALIVTLGLGHVVAEEVEFHQPAQRPGTGQQPAQIATATYNVELVGQIGGMVNSVAVQGDYAYVGAGPRLIVLDVSDPTQPTVVGESRVFSDVVKNVYVTGHYAYLAVGDAGLRVLDVSDPVAPVEVGHSDLPGQARRVHVVGNYAYIIADEAGLRVVDVTDPTSPTEIGAYEPSWRPSDLFVAGSYAYVADTYRSGLRVVDISDPAAPIEVGYHAMPGHVAGVHIAGNYAYVVWHHEDVFAPEFGLQVVDVSDPRTPVEVGRHALPPPQPFDVEGARGIYVTDNYAFVAAGDAGLRVIDVSDPTAPVEVGYALGNAQDVFVAGDPSTGSGQVYAYVVAEEAGLWVVDVSNVVPLVELSTYETPGPAHSVYVAGDYAYVAAEGAGLRVINVSDPAVPMEVGHIDLPWQARSVHVSGHYAYIGAEDLWVVDVSDPSAPVEVGVYEPPWPWDISDVYVAGDHAYVAAERAGLRVVDVSDPAAPVEVGAHTPEGKVFDVYIAGNYAYLTAGWDGLRVVDISDPTAPVEVGAYDSPWNARSIYVAGNYAYVGAHYSGLRVIDVSDPTKPEEVGAHNTPAGVAPDVFVAGDYVYMTEIIVGQSGAREGSALRVVDISDPTAPTEMGSYDLPGEARDLFVAGGYAYVATRHAGLRVYRVSNFAGPVRVSTYDLPGSAQDVFVAGNQAYVVSGNGSLRATDTSDPATPVEVGVYDPPENILGVYLAGNYAYATWHVSDPDHGGLQVVNVSTPSAPIKVGLYDVELFAPQDVFVARHYAYVTDERFLRVIDVSDPTTPVEVGAYDTDDPRLQIRGVYVAGDYAYLVRGRLELEAEPRETWTAAPHQAMRWYYAGLRIVDISDPTAPVEVGGYDPRIGVMPGESWNIYVASSYAYVAAGSAGLRVIDISDPAAPVEVGVYEPPWPWDVSDVYVAGDRAHVTAAGDLLILDVSDPTTPVEVSHYVTPGNAQNVHVAGRSIYVADGEGGLLVLRLAPSISVSIATSGGSLSSPFDQTSYIFASGTFTDTVTIIHTPRYSGNTPSTGSLIGINHFFEVNAVYSTTGRPAQPTRPFTVTVQYTDAEQGPAIGDTLALYAWDGSQWTREPTSMVDTEANLVTAAPDHFGLWAVLGETHRVYLPNIAKQRETELDRTLYPNYELADRIWQAVERFVEVYPLIEIYPGYASEAGGPSAENARANVEAACHDFPDLPDPFGAGVHQRACYQWVAVRLGLYHTVSAYRSHGFSRGGESNDDLALRPLYELRSAQAQDITWAQHYLDATLDYLAEFVYGPEDSPTGIGYRDTLAAVWQNPVRALGVTIMADLLRKQGALDPEHQARVEELLSGIVRAWYAEFWETGQHPTTGVPFTIRIAPEIEAHSLAGHQVVSTRPWTFHWDADKGNTPAEEVAWMGAGMMLASRVLGHRMSDADETYAAARHYVDFAIAYDRPDPIHGGTVRTLNAETTGGAYGQRRYWIENHAPDVPSIPYMGATWNFIDVALLASDTSTGLSTSPADQQPWPTLVPDDDQWQVLLRSAGETMRAADGTFLVDFTPGRGIGYNLDRFPGWWTPCGEGQPGRPYVHYDGRAGGPELYISEGGGAAGLNLLLAGWPLMRIAAHRGDEASYNVWAGRLNRVLDEYIANPPNLGWKVCKTAPFVSDNPGYHWPSVLVLYLIPYLGSSGYGVEPWTP